MGDCNPRRCRSWGVRRDSNPLCPGSQPGASTASASHTAEDRGVEPQGFTPRPFSKRDAPPRRAVFLQLTRQDSNLNRLNQNQQCYWLHHGSSVRAEGFEPPVPECRWFTARCDTPASPRTLGYPGRSRTCNLLRNRELLCQLSYGATCFVVARREVTDLPPRPTGFKPIRGPGSDPDRGVHRAPRAAAYRLPPVCGHSCGRCTARTP